MLRGPVILLQATSLILGLGVMGWGRSEGGGLTFAGYLTNCSNVEMGGTHILTHRSGLG